MQTQMKPIWIEYSNQKALHLLARMQQRFPFPSAFRLKKQGDLRNVSETETIQVSTVSQRF